MLAESNERHTLRAAIDATLRTDPDLDAFCLDFFPQVHRRFGGGMQRPEKVNLLFSLVETQAITAKLRLCAEPGHRLARRGSRWLWGLAVAAVLAVSGGFLVLRWGWLQSA